MPRYHVHGYISHVIQCQPRPNPLEGGEACLTVPKGYKRVSPYTGTPIQQLEQPHCVIQPSHGRLNNSLLLLYHLQKLNICQCCKLLISGYESEDYSLNWDSNISNQTPPLFSLTIAVLLISLRIPVIMIALNISTFSIISFANSRGWDFSYNPLPNSPDASQCIYQTTPLSCVFLLP